MDLVRDEKPGEFNNTLYYKLCEATVIVPETGAVGGFMPIIVVLQFKFCVTLTTYVIIYNIYSTL